jgi:hypothetical protein
VASVTFGDQIKIDASLLASVPAKRRTAFTLFAIKDQVIIGRRSAGHLDRVYYSLRKARPLWSLCIESIHIYGFMASVKTTLEIPETLFRQLKVSAAKQGKTIRAVVNEALTEKLNRSQHGVEDVPAWRVAFGGLRRLRVETAKINRDIAAEFSRVSADEWK